MNALGLFPGINECEHLDTAGMYLKWSQYGLGTVGKFNSDAHMLSGSGRDNGTDPTLSKADTYISITLNNTSFSKTPKVVYVKAFGRLNWETDVGSSTSKSGSLSNSVFTIVMNGPINGNISAMHDIGFGLGAKFNEMMPANVSLYNMDAASVSLSNNGSVSMLIEIPRAINDGIWSKKTSIDYEVSIMGYVFG